MTTENRLLKSAAERLPLMEKNLDEAREALQFLRESGQPDEEGTAALLEAEQQLAQMRAALETRGLLKSREL